MEGLRARGSGRTTRARTSEGRPRRTPREHDGDGRERGKRTAGADARGRARRADGGRVDGAIGVGAPSSRRGIVVLAPRARDARDDARGPRERRDARVRVRQRGVADASIRERARGGRRRDERGTRSGVRGRRRDVAGRERRGRGAVAAETRAGAAIGDAVEAEGRAERLDARARARDSETCATRPDRTRRDPSRRPRSSIVLLSSDRSNDRSARCFFSPPAPPRRFDRPA